MKRNKQQNNRSLKSSRDNKKKKKENANKKNTMNKRDSNGNKLKQTVKPWWPKQKQQLKKNA